MDAPTSWVDLALKSGYIATAMRRRGIPEYAIEDAVSAAVLECLERDAKGQKFPGEVLATVGLVGRRVAVWSRQKVAAEELQSYRTDQERELSAEDEATAEQFKEWSSLTDSERLSRAHESRVALGTSLSPETVIRTWRRQNHGR